MSDLDPRLNPNLFPTPTTNPTTADLTAVSPLLEDNAALTERAQRFSDAGFGVEHDSTGQYTITELPE